MKRLLAGIEIALLVALIATNSGSFQIHESDQNKDALDQFASLSLAFEPNLGQAGDEVEYLVHHGKATTYFTPSETVTTVGDEQLRMSLEGSNRNPAMSGDQELPSKTNYFIGNDQSKWQSNVPNFKQLFMDEIYPGIDLKYYGNNQQALEHDFIVAPGADPSQISIQFEGQKDISLDTDGGLKLAFENTEMELRNPTTYQEIDGRRQFVDSSYDIGSDGAVQISLDEYDSSKTLIIDPVLLLEFSTYLGGTGTDSGQAITIDAANNVYVAGNTTSTDFPTSLPFQASPGGTGDVFVSKFNAAGSALVYSTYLGGSALDILGGIAVDTSNNLFINGQTASTDFPTASPIQGANGGGADSFVAKLNATGSGLAYSTYIGGTGLDQGKSIAVDTSGSVYISGTTSSLNFPTASPFQASNGGLFDTFLSKLNPAGSAFVFSTYLGGSGNDASFSPNLAVDTSGNIYVAGQTSSTDFPTASPFQASNGGGTDIYIAKFNPSASALIYSTYLGGSGTDGSAGGDIAIDSGGNVYVTGNTTSSDFPTASPLQASNGGGSQDAFAAKLNAAGAALTYSTYLGGTGSDVGNGINVDTSGNAYIAGQSFSSNFPTGFPYQPSLDGTSDGFIAKLNSTGTSFIYSTYLGGSSTETATAVALNANRDAYITGDTGSSDFPVTSAFQGSNGGGTDVFVTKITDQDTANLLVTVAPVLTFALNVNLCDFGHLSTSETKYCNHTVTASTNASGGYTISYIPTTTMTSGANTIDDMSSLTSSSLGTEQFGLNLKANTAAGSFTAADFGADESGGAGSVISGYDIGDMFKFDTGGDDVAQSASVSATTTFTASYIANITGLTESGTYGTLMTYNIVASY